MQFSCLHGVCVLVLGSCCVKAAPPRDSSGTKCCRCGPNLWIISFSIKFRSPMSNSSWRHKRPKLGDPRQSNMWDHEKLLYSHWQSWNGKPLPTQDFHIVFSFFHVHVLYHKLQKYFSLNKNFSGVFHLSTPINTTPTFFSVMSGATGTLRPLPMQISDAERFCDFGERWSFRRVPRWINGGGKGARQGKLFGKYKTYPPPKNS